MNFFSLLAFFFYLNFFSLQAFGFASETLVALTIDDLPAAGAETHGLSRLEIADNIIKILKQNQVFHAYGFTNGVLVKGMAERLKILKDWKLAGFSLGNHTFSHLDLSLVTAAQFIDDIEKNEQILIDYASSIEELKWLRLPYLHEGETKEKRYEVRNYLKNRNYKIAPVSINFDDWAFSETWKRCRDKSDSLGLKKLEALYIDHAIKHLKMSEEVSSKIFKRKIKQVLLLHFSAVTSQFLDHLLQEYKKNGVRFIALADAQSDPVYLEDTVYLKPIGTVFPLQALESRGLKPNGYSIPQLPIKDLEALCGSH